MWKQCRELLHRAPGRDERFPYSVYFIELPTRIRILAFAHARRRPFYWNDRL